MKTLLFAVAMCMAGMACAGICVKDGETIAFMGDSITAGGKGMKGQQL